MKKGEMKIEIHGFDTVHKIARISGNSAAIGVPKEWHGKEVKAVLLKELG